MLKRYTLLVGTAFAFAGFTPAFAQPTTEAAAEEAGEDADIIVTATRREERLQDVPVAVTAIGSETLRTRGIEQVLDLGGGRVPGLQVTTLSGTETALQIYIRGFGAGDSSQGTFDLPVALYIDGVNVPRSQGSGLDFVTPERIEILRGPQGQLFGRNAHSGAVQIVSKRPTGRWEGDFMAGLGTYGTVQSKGRLDLPEIAGFRIQLSGNYRKHDGYKDNPYNPNYANATFIPDPQSHTRFINHDFNGDWYQLETYGGRVAVERDFGNLNFFYSYDNSRAEEDQGTNEFLRSDEVGTIYTGFSPTRPSSIITSTNFSGPGGSQVSFTQNELGDDYPKFAPYGSPRIGFITKAQGHILNLTYEASDNLTLRSITGHRIVTQKGGHVQNGVLGAGGFSSSTAYLRSKMFSEELQAIVSVGNLDLTAGALYFEEKVNHELGNALVRNCVALPAVAAANCVPGSSQATTAPHSPNSFKRSLSNVEAYGLYAQGTYTIGPVELTAGARYSRDTKHGARVIDRTLGIDITTGTGVVRRNRFHTSRVDPAFTVKYNFTDQINAYARYAVGFRDGGSSVRSSTFSAFDEDEIESWELGFKSQLFDRRVTFNAAAFHNTIKGQQLSIQEDPLGNVSLTNVINSVVDRKIKGFEVELTVTPIRGLTLSGAYTYLKANNVLFGYDAGTLAPFAPGATFSPTTGLIPDAATIAAHPNSQILLVGPQGTPKHSGSINVDYVVPVGESNILIHVDWARTSTYLNSSPDLGRTNIRNGVVAVLPAFNAGTNNNRVNARIAFREIALKGSATAEISLWAKNLFDHVDRAFAFPVGITSVVSPAPPRVVGADFRVKF